jgi:hypothetical protein
MKKQVFVSLATLITMITLIVGCVKDEPDAPPATNSPYNPDKVLTIGEVKNMIIENEGPFTFDESYYLFATVVADESSGNIYESSFVMDHTGGIQLNFYFTSGLYLGDSVRFDLKGSRVSQYYGLYQIENLKPDSSVYKLSTQNYIEPTVLSITDLENNIDYYQCTPITINDVQFMYSELNKTYADADNQQTGEVYVEECDGKSILIRSSGFANFAGDTVDQGKGSVTAIATVYESGANKTVQLVIRDIHEIVMDDARCTVDPIDPVNGVSETFDDVLDGQTVVTEGWTNFITSGHEYWKGAVYTTEAYAEASGYNTDLDEMVVWLITPPVINTNGDAVLNFKSAKAYWEHQFQEPLSIWVSTDFDGSNFENGATWTEIEANIVSQNDADHTFIPSGDIYLDEFVGNVSVAFRYSGSDFESTTIRIDDVSINTGGEPIYAENFDSGWGGWQTISKTGGQVWQQTDNGPDGSPCADMNGFENGYFANNDWLVSPQINLADYETAGLYFESAKNYEGDDLIIRVTDNYSGDPATTTWTTLSADLSPGGFSWTSSGKVDLSNFAGAAVWIAFEYNSTSSSGANWRVDNILIKAN